MSLSFDLLEKINLLEVSVVVLSKAIRSQTGWQLFQCLSVARAIKEAHRLGVMRGRLLK
jgi:hypothetical protein